MTMKNRKDVWQTAVVKCYCGTVTEDDGAAAGAVTLTQVRYRDGRWQRRDVASNRGQVAEGAPLTIPDDEGRDLWALVATA